MPKSAAKNAAAYPPGPAPITATRRLEVFVILLLILASFLLRNLCIQPNDANQCSQEQQHLPPFTQPNEERVFFKHGHHVGMVHMSLWF
jgi:hypothetical protein